MSAQLVTRWVLVALCAGAAASCACTARTRIDPLPPKVAAQDVYVPPGGCNVRDYPAATDVPSGAKNLGWVTVTQQGSDEETFLLLRQKICEAGGDALSQAAWVKAPTEEVPQLTANAWALP